MRKLQAVVLLVVILGSVGLASAQDWKQAMRYEIKAGLVSTYLSSNNYQDSGIGWGWTAGGGLFLPFFTKYLGIQADVMYTNQELVIQTLDDANRLQEYNLTANYIEIPLLIQLALSDNVESRFYLMGGVSTAFNATANVSWTDTDGKHSEDLTGVNSTEWTPILGFGLRASAFMIELRFGFGTRDLGESSDGEPDNEVALDTKVNRSTFMIGFSF